MSGFFDNAVGVINAATAGKKKPLPKPQVLPKPAPAPPINPVSAPPIGPPAPVLQAHGFHGGLGDFANKVQAAGESYAKAYGTKIPPDLALHLAVSPVPAEHFPSLFSVPQNATAAKARPVVNRAVPYTPHELIRGLREAAKGDGFGDYLDQHHAALALLQKDARYAGTVNAIVLGEQHQKLQAMGLGDFHRGSSITTKALGQVADSLIHSPEGLFQDGKAAVLDTGEVLAPGSHGGSFKRTRGIGKAMVQQVREDVTHPGDNPGYLLLDVFGALSLGAGGAARVANASRVGRVGAVLEKPPLRRAVISHGGYTEEALLSSNPLVATVQSALLKQRQRGADLRLAGGDTIPGSARSVLVPAGAQEWWDRNFSFERKVGRESAARQRVEHAASLSLARDLEHASATANATGRVFGKIGRKRLTRGQQKAIWVLATDDPDPLAANLAFHQRMIDSGIGDKRAHRRQIADLKLAGKVLANPTPEFQRIVDLTRDVVGEMERQKIERLGLAPTTAEGRVAKLAQILRGDEPAGGAKASPDSFYLPTSPRGKQKRGPSAIRGFYGATVGPFGIPAGRRMPELTHEFTGKAISAGNIRIDSTALATEAYARTVRAVSVKAQHDKLWEHGSPVKRSEWDIPVRDTNEIPDKLRELVAKLDEGDFTKAEADLLPDDMAAIIRELYPGEKDIRADEIDHVRWVDSRLVGELEGAPSRVSKSAAQVAQVINAPIRFVRLYARPAYILNKVGNQAMLVFDQGFLNSVHNIARAMNAEARYGEKSASTIRTLVGQGKSKSFAPPESGRWSRGVAEWWSRWTDRDERVASFLYYADRKGYVSREQMDKLLTDETLRGDLQEVTRRANKALVEFDNLTPLEKNLLRHLIFVYPWVSRSMVWSLRAIMEHPAKVAILANLGEHALETDPFLDRAPEWFKRVGYVPIGWNSDGTPKVVNPASINTFSTLGEFLSIAKAGVEGDNYAAVGDLAGPFAEFGVHAITGRDEYGNRYPEGQWWGAAKDVLKGLPQLSSLNRREDKPLKPFDVTDRASLAAHYRSALKQTVFTPGWLQGFGSLIAGGFSPRGVNTAALEARYWRDATPAQKRQWERKMLADALVLQGELLGKPVPGKVASAIQLQADLSAQRSAFAKEHGRPPTARETADLTLGFLEQKGRLTAAQHAELAGKLKPLVDGSQIESFTNRVLAEHADGKALREWDSDVRLVASFSRETVAAKLRILKAQGLASDTAVPSDEALTEYGRRYLAYTKELKTVGKRVRDGDATAADLRAFVDGHDTPQGGLPSFARMGWANLTADEQEQALRDAAGTSWARLTNFDKRLLGVDVPADVSKGWAAYEKAVSEYHKVPGNTALQIEQKQALVKQVDRVYPGFGKDWAFAQQPRAVQFEHTRVYEALPDRDLYDEVLGGPAKKLAATIRENGNASYYRDFWRKYLAEQVTPWLLKHSALKKELADMGRDFMPGLVSQG